MLEVKDLCHLTTGAPADIQMSIQLDKKQYQSNLDSHEREMETLRIRLVQTEDRANDAEQRARDADENSRTEYRREIEAAREETRRQREEAQRWK